MDIDKIELNQTIRLLMKNLGDSQTKLGTVIGLSQPQVGKRLKPPEDEEAVDWSFGELREIALHWGIPLVTLCSGRTAALQWVTDNVIDLTGRATRSRACDYMTGSQEPLPFPQDDDGDVIDLREHILNQTAQKDSLELYANTG